MTLDDLERPKRTLVERWVLWSTPKNVGVDKVSAHIPSLIDLLVIVKIRYSSIARFSLG